MAHGTHEVNVFSETMLGLGRADWYAALQDIGEAQGFYEPLGDKHSASFLDQGETLLVTFESRQGIQALSDTGQPLGFDITPATGWSHLALISEGDTWFRDPAVWTFFENLDDDGFFDDFERVIFYGAGPCGYAAAAYARCAQDAIVVAVQPQATLNPRISGWDGRFTDHRMTDFSGPFGFAPEFLDLTDQTYVIFDPREGLDAMHAALFLSPKTTFLRTPFLGAAVQTSLLDMALLYRILVRAAGGKLSERWFYAALRARRNHLPYLRNLLATLERGDRPDLLETLCSHVTARMTAPKFQKRLDQLRAG